MDGDSGVAVEQMEPIQLGGHLLEPYSTLSHAYLFKVFGGLKDQKLYTFQMSLNTLEKSLDQFKRDKLHELFKNSGG